MLWIKCEEAWSGGVSSTLSPGVVVVVIVIVIIVMRMMMRALCEMAQQASKKDTTMTKIMRMTLTTMILISPVNSESK